MATDDAGNSVRKFKLVFLGEQSGKISPRVIFCEVIHFGFSWQNSSDHPVYVR